MNAKPVRVLVFDADAWNGKDVGDNSQFFKPATILRRYLTRYGEEVADVRFDSGRVSNGHFTNVMKEIEESK